MASLLINSPVDGSFVAPSTAFDVCVSWDASAFKASPYEITCTGAAPLGGQPATGTHTFSVTAPASGSLTITSELKDSTGSVLASDTITVTVSAPTPVGGITKTALVPAPAAAAAPLPDWYVCGTYNPAAVAHLVCVTYKVRIDKDFPRDGAAGPPFVVSKKQQTWRQYSVAGGNLKMNAATGVWQATIPPNVAVQADRLDYQIQVWFFDANWQCKGTVSTQVAQAIRAVPCLP